MIKQNKIAVVMDWDLTIIPDNMQYYLFKQFHNLSDQKAFERKNEWINLLNNYQEEGYSNEIAHSKAFIDLMPKVSNADLRHAGSVAFDYNPGILELLPNLRKSLGREETYKDIEIIGSIVSSGYSEPIKGSQMAQTLLDGQVSEKDLEWLVFGGKFVEDDDGFIADIGSTVSMTEKTQQLYRVNKGPRIPLNDSVKPDEREVPFSYMIYIGDGPSDVPAASVTKKEGGHVHIVYNPKNPEAVQQLFGFAIYGERSHTQGPMDYRPNAESNHTYLMIEQAVLQAANRMLTTVNRRLEDMTVPSARHV
jgi:hypothetical protein